MKALQSIWIAGTLGLASGLPGAAHAQAGHDHHAAPGAATAKTTQTAADEMSQGEVRKVDTVGKKITLKHGPLKNLDMPGMTMAFEVADPAMLGQVKAGDKVRFTATNPGGKLTITKLEPAK